MDISKLVRNPAAIKSILFDDNGRSNSLIAKENCIIHFPKRYLDIGLGYVGVENSTHSIFAIIDEHNNYSVSLVNAMMKVEPYKTQYVSINGVEYVNFYFEAGSVITNNLNLVKKDTLIYNVANEFIIQGKFPWFLNYDDKGKLFDTAKDFADSNVGSLPEIVELYASISSRDPRDKTKYYRKVINEGFKASPANIGLKQVVWAATNTVSKITGNYFTDGVVSAIVNPSDETQNIETLLRI